MNEYLVLYVGHGLDLFEYVNADKMSDAVLQFELNGYIVTKCVRV